jgi:hypothetical protein
LRIAKAIGHARGVRAVAVEVEQQRDIAIARQKVAKRIHQLPVAREAMRDDDGRVRPIARWAKYLDRHARRAAQLAHDAAAGRIQANQRNSRERKRDRGDNNETTITHHRARVYRPRAGMPDNSAR